MQRQQVTSRIIHSVGYDPAEKVLEVELLRRQKEQKRSIYRYANVHEDKWKAMMAANSIGSFFLTMIKPNHPCTKLEEPSAEQETQDSGEATTGGEAA
jgi:KTSC domain-containing protein